MFKHLALDLAPINSFGLITKSKIENDPIQGIAFIFYFIFFEKKGIAFIINANHKQLAVQKYTHVKHVNEFETNMKFEALLITGTNK